jgi:uncharacterized membrane protein YGL010W
MKNLTEHLTQYAFYHQNPKNVNTHFIGIPMIVLAVTVLLSRPVWGEWNGIFFSPALLVSLLSLLFYVRLDLLYGAIMALILGCCLACGQWLAAQSTWVWMVSGIGLFVVGWAFQFLGHYYEGKKPAFVDDLVGLLVGPLFLVAEVSFMLKMRTELQTRIQHQLNLGKIGEITY